MPAMPPRREVTMRVAKEAMKFSAGHFTLFGPGRRERLHGHDYRVVVTFRAPVGPDGLCFDYGLLKRHLRAVCDTLDEYVLLPGESPLLSLEREGPYVYALFGEERIPFLATDVLVLPLANISLEELARYVLGRILEAPGFGAWGVAWLEVAVDAGPDQSACSEWNATR
jgi:6-pyruvoyltetrahydropterin/6-carboxytetrahydropterin synthase